MFRADQGVDDPEVGQAMEAYFAEVDEIPDVTVVSPYGRTARTRSPQAGDDAGQVAYAQVEVPQDMSFEETTEVADHMEELMPTVDGVQIELGGQIFAEFEPPVVRAARPRASPSSS